MHTAGQNRKQAELELRNSLLQDFLTAHEHAKADENYGDRLQSELLADADLRTKIKGHRNHSLIARRYIAGLLPGPCRRIVREYIDEVLIRA